MIVGEINKLLTSKNKGLVKWLKQANGTPDEYKPDWSASERQMAEEFVAGICRQVSPGPERDESKRSFLTASKVGKCVRALALEKLGAIPEPINARGKLTFSFGNMLEAMYRYLLRSIDSEQFKFIETNERQPIAIAGEETSGYYDGIIEAHWTLYWEALGGDKKWWEDTSRELGKENLRSVFEMKTMADYSFKRAVRENAVENSYGYRTQLGLYVRQAMLDKRIDIPVGVFFLVNKNTGGIAELWKTMKQLQDDIELGDDNFSIVSGVIRNNEKLPPRPFEANAHGVIPNFPCGYCNFKYDCFSSDKVTGWELSDLNKETPQYRPLFEDIDSMDYILDLDVYKGKPVFVVKNNRN